MTMRGRGSVAVPGIVAAMQRDPRVALAQQAMQAGSSTDPAYGKYSGLARVLQGAMGGLMAKKQEDKFLGQQQDYMDDVNMKLARVLDGPMQDQPLGIQSDPGASTPLAGGDPRAAIAGMASAAPPGMGPSPAMGQGGPQGAPPLPVGNAGTPAPPIPPAGPTGGPPPAAPMAPGTPPATPPGMPPGMPPTAMPQGIPATPQVGQVPESIRKKLGMALMGGGNPYSFNQGLDDLYAGLQEDAQSAKETRDRQFEYDKLGYSAALGDAYQARGDARNFDYTTRRDATLNRYDTDKLRQQFNNQWALQKDDQRFRGSEADKELAYRRWEKVVDATGEIPDIGAIDNDSIFEALIQQESHGDGMAKSDQGALGSTQMLPDTARAMAEKLGIPWQPAMLQSNDPAALDYQRTLGRAYFDEGMEKYNGDVEKALMYYHGGPDEKQWGPKTRAYVGQVFSHLPVSGLAAPRNAGYSQALFGLNPNRTAGKPLTATATNLLNTNASTLVNVLERSNTFKDSYVGSGVDAMGRIGNYAREATGLGDQDRVEWWKQYDGMNNIVRKDLFGTALTANEKNLWDRSVITTGTNPEVARKHLDTQKRILEGVLKRQSRAFGAAYNQKQIYELIGGADMEDSLHNYKPLSAAQTKAGTGTGDRPVEIVMNGETYVSDGKGGWNTKGNSKPKPAAPPVKSPMLAAASIFGQRPQGLLAVPPPSNAPLIMQPQFRR